jgi:hypothetical protein
MAALTNPDGISKVAALANDLREAAGGPKAMEQAKAALTKSIASGAVAARRELPQASSLLTAAHLASTARRAVSKSLGPFADRFGREVFIDIFDTLQMVAFVRTGDPQPFLLVEPSGLPLTAASVSLS